jgi:hypothetical protein
MGEDVTGPLTVGCECGEWVGVEPYQAGTAVFCGCRRRVVVPLLDEFRERPDLVSASTIERRVIRLVAEGELPLTGTCARCGAAEDGITRVILVCERYTARSGGGERFLIVPFITGVFWMSWREEEWTEIRGRDTDVIAPVCLCGLCLRHLRGRPGRAYLLPAAAAVGAGVLVGLANPVVGIVVGWAGLVGVALWRRASRRGRQRELKQVLGRVPAYRQVLTRYRHAVAVLPRG